MDIKPTALLADVKSFFPMVWAVLRGRYKMPWNTLLWVVVCVIYFISPIDALPDVLPLLGIADDSAFILWVLTRVHKDLVAFRQQEKEKPEIILDVQATKRDKPTKK